MDTSLHIALCDSDPGDRKQMERLLMRESDKRVNTTGVFYTDTYGGVNALLSAILVYDVYFLDVREPGCDSFDTAKALREKGIVSPIVFCVSKAYYRQFEQLPGTFFMDKPIKVNELGQVLDEVIRHKVEDYIPTIELRNNTESFHVTEDEVMYFEGKNFDTGVYLNDGRIKRANISISMLTLDVSNFESYLVISRNVIINTKYVQSVGFMSVTMKDGTRFSVSHKKAVEIGKKKSWK